MTPDEVVELAEGLARVAAGGGGARALTAHLSRHLGAGVRLDDAEGRTIASAGTIGGAGTAVPVRSGDDRLGELHADLAGDAASGVLLRLAAAAIALELARESGGAAGRRRAFWDRLVSGAYRDFASARADAAARGIALASHYVAIALEPFDAAEAATRSLAAGEGAGSLERDAGLLLLLPAAREIDAANARTAAMLLSKNAVLCGGIGSVEAAADAGRSVARADAALAVGRSVFGDGRVVAYDELGAYALLLDGGDAEELRAFARATLAPLREYDERHQTELERTLGAYFACGQNVKTAAADLHVHRHTVFYRLRQIGEICRRSLDDPHDQLTLRMAMAIDALHS